MPYSSILFDQQVRRFIEQKKFSKYLDIGSGAGKYGQIIREVIENPYIETIEPEKKYIKEFKLIKLYDKIYNTGVEHFFDSRPDYTTNVVIIGDCIEHLKKSDGIDLINFLVYRCNYLIIIFPSKVIQYSWQGHSMEAHRSIWTRNDFEDFDYQYFRKEFMNLVIVKGLLEDKHAIKVE